MSWRQLLNWWAYYEVEPFGEARAELRSAHIISTLAEINRDSSKKPTPWNPLEFVLPPYDELYRPVAAKPPAKPMTKEDEWQGFKKMMRNIALSAEEADA